MNRRDFIKAGITLSAGLLAGCQWGKATQDSPSHKDHLPNIILINADDLGIGMLGCYGQKIVKTNFSRKIDKIYVVIRVINYKITKSPPNDVL